MAYQAIFKRYEIKYLLDEEQKKALLKAMEPYMRLDGYGRTTIRNIYFDTEDYRIIRRSLEKPAYKEKLRIRSYKAAESGDTVFAELKKKYNSGCGLTENARTESSSSDGGASETDETAAVSSSDMFTDRDMEVGYDAVHSDSAVSDALPAGKNTFYSASIFLIIKSASSEKVFFCPSVRHRQSSENTSSSWESIIL